MSAAHFDAHLGTGPDIPDGPPGHVLVQGLNKVTHDLLELTQVGGLDSLGHRCPEEVVTRGLVRATCQPCDLWLPEITRVPNFSQNVESLTEL